MERERFWGHDEVAQNCVAVCGSPAGESSEGGIQEGCSVLDAVL